MAQRIEAKDSPDDFPTPPWATRALIEHILANPQALSRKSCLEPACGVGHMVRVLKEYFGTVDYPDRILIQVYTQKRKIDRALRVQEAFIAQSPDNLQYRSDTAKTYLLLGRKSDAMRIVKEAADRNPALKSEVEKILQAIQSGTLK